MTTLVTAKKDIYGETRKRRANSTLLITSSLLLVTSVAKVGFLAFVELSSVSSNNSHNKYGGGGSYVTSGASWLGLRINRARFLRINQLEDLFCKEKYFRKTYTGSAYCSVSLCLVIRGCTNYSLLQMLSDQSRGNQELTSCEEKPSFQPPFACCQIVIDV